MKNARTLSRVGFGFDVFVRDLRSAYLSQGRPLAGQEKAIIGNTLSQEARPAMQSSHGAAVSPTAAPCAISLALLLNWLSISPN